jgi:hypothetical protein
LQGRIGTPIVVLVATGVVQYAQQERAINSDATRVYCQEVEKTNRLNRRPDPRDPTDLDHASLDLVALHPERYPQCAGARDYWTDAIDDILAESRRANADDWDTLCPERR